MIYPLESLRQLVLQLLFHRAATRRWASNLIYHPAGGLAIDLQERLLALVYSPEFLWFKQKE